MKVLVKTAILLLLSFLKPNRQSIFFDLQRVLPPDLTDVAPAQTQEMSRRPEPTWVGRRGASLSAHHIWNMVIQQLL
jgi:hypothetical protein